MKFAGQVTQFLTGLFYMIQKSLENCTKSLLMCSSHKMLSNERNNMTKEDWQKLYNDARNDNERNALDIFVSMMMTIRKNIVLRTKSKKDIRQDDGP